MPSNAIDVKTALRALIDGIPGLDAHTLTWGAARTPDKKWVYLGKTEWNSSEWVTNRTRAEDFTIEVVVNIQIARGTSEEAERAAHEAARLIEQAVTNNPNLGLAAVVSSDFVPKSLASWPVDNGIIEGQCEAGVRVTARFSREA